jgi:hypothetical protein
MKKLVIGAVVTGGALLGLRHTVRHGHKLCDHRGGTFAGCCHPVEEERRSIDPSAECVRDESDMPMFDSAGRS